MQIAPEVIASLNEVFALEVTTFEVTHAFEHVFKRKGYKALRGWFDCEVAASRDRRRYLTDRCFQLDGALLVAMRATSVDPNQGTQEFLSASLALLVELMGAYQKSYEAVEAAGDSVTARVLCEYLETVEHVVGRLETFLGQIAEIGLSEFLGQKIR